MTPFYIETTEPKAVEELIERLASNPKTKSAIIAVADATPHLDELAEVFKNTTLPLVGGVFPGIIFEGKSYDQGVLVIGLQSALTVEEIDLSRKEFVTEKAELPLDVLTQSKRMGLLTIIDAFSPNKQVLIDMLFNRYGLSVDYFGGGAGSLSFESKPCIITNKGIRSNCAAIALVHSEVEVGVAHGWEAISKPMKVTETNDNLLISLEWKPAFDVYRDIVESHSEQSFEELEFFDLAKSYPFGKAILQAEPVIRDPIAKDAHKIRLIDAVEHGSFIQIMHGNKEKLLAGAKHAADKIGAQNNNNALVLCIDCISRSLYLGNEFEDELECIGPPQQVFGFLTIGEIANTGESSLEIYNKTIAVVRLK